MRADAHGQALGRLHAFLGVPGDRVQLTSDRERGWLADFSAAAPWLEIEVNEALDATLTLEGSRPHGAIRFRGEVEGRVLESLAETLLALATHAIQWDTPATPALLDALPGPMQLSVYVGAQCPFCPSVAAAALRMACASERLSVDVVRAELARESFVRSVPTIARDGALLTVGSVGEYELAERLAATSD